MKYIIDAHFDLLTDVVVRRKNGVLDMKEHNYSDERISLLAGKNWLYAFKYDRTIRSAFPYVGSRSLPWRSGIDSPAR